MTEMTMPAMAPGLRLDDEEELDSPAEPAPDDDDADGVGLEVDVADDTDVKIVPIPIPVPVIVLEPTNVPPKTCANNTTLFVPQQSVLSPQHHFSLSALPLHGVTRTLPAGYLLGQTLRQDLLVMSALVQKSTQ